jgi:hypothetical protein
MTELRSAAGDIVPKNKAGQTISLAKEVICEYQLTDLQPLLGSIERQSQLEHLNVAVWGRLARSEDMQKSSSPASGASRISFPR